VEEKTLHDLLDILRAHPGPCPVFMEIITTRNRTVQMRVGARFSVQPSGKFASEVEAILGQGHVAFKAGDGNGGQVRRSFDNSRSRFARRRRMD
jgi:hypothetical protein